MQEESLGRVRRASKSWQKARKLIQISVNPATQSHSGPGLESALRLDGDELGEAGLLLRHVKGWPWAQVTLRVLERITVH